MPDFPDYGSAVVSYMNIVTIAITYVIINAMWVILTFTYYSSIKNFEE